MIAAIPSSTLLGVDGHAVSVEVHVANGLPGCTVVGLPDASCREARDRVRAAFSSTRLTWPQQRITINLAPSNLRKTGSAFDLAIAVGVLVAAEVLPVESVAGMGFIGELGLDGTIHRVDGIVGLVAATECSTVVVPANCVDQAAVSRRDVRGVATLGDLVQLLSGECESDVSWTLPGGAVERIASPEPDIADVRGQPVARWAVEVAAAGGHNLLFVGAPGSGKSMLARRLCGLLPELDDQTAHTATRVHSAAGLLTAANPLVWRPPFRAPHHSSTVQSIVGGGTRFLRPGELSLAHGGVLFLDELAEFPRAVLDSLRQPLETGEVTIGRAVHTVHFPARVQLVGAMNPCPCGEGMLPGACRCSQALRDRYAARVSTPLLDRFDIRVLVHRPTPDTFLDTSRGESSACVAQRVAAARALAAVRNVRCNSELEDESLERWAPLSSAAKAVLNRHLRLGTLTGRGVHRVRRVARTLCDLSKPDGAADSEIDEQAVCAAIELRSDRRELAAAS